MYEKRFESPQPSKRSIALHNALLALGVENILEKRLDLFGGPTYYLDIYVPSVRLGIEVDDVRHRDPDRIVKDRRRTRLLKEFADITVERIENSGIDIHGAEKVALAIKTIVEKMVK
jgi:very-short-patch-repair endonuclease